MSDLATIDKLNPADWIRLADTLMQKGIAAIQSADRDTIRAVQADVLAFALAANTACPPATLESMNDTNRQLGKALTAIMNDKLEAGNPVLENAGLKVNLAATTVRVEIAKLQLKQVREVLGQLNGIASDVRGLRNKLNEIPKKDLPGKLDAILALIQEFDTRIRGAVG